MKTIYVMLSIVGWAWFVIVFAFLFVRLRQRPAETLGDREQRS